VAALLQEKNKTFVQNSQQLKTQRDAFKEEIEIERSTLRFVRFGVNFIISHI
jgi:hypothetical protein